MCDVGASISRVSRSKKDSSLSFGDTANMDPIGVRLIQTKGVSNGVWHATQYHHWPLIKQLNLSELNCSRGDAAATKQLAKPNQLGQRHFKLVLCYISGASAYDSRSWIQSADSPRLWRNLSRSPNMYVSTARVRLYLHGLRSKLPEHPTRNDCLHIMLDNFSAKSR